MQLRRSKSFPYLITNLVNARVDDTASSNVSSNRDMSSAGAYTVESTLISLPLGSLGHSVPISLSLDCRSVTQTVVTLSLAG